MRFDIAAVRALAAAGIEVVLIGMAAPPELHQLAGVEPRIHLLGQRPPAEVAAYLLHCDVGIVPHTDEPFTRSMEPHKAYNYAAAGLRTVTLNTAHAPALGPFLEPTATVDAFVSAARGALDRGRLSPQEIARARSLSWDRVADSLIAAEPAAADPTPFEVIHG